MSLRTRLAAGFAALVAVLAFGEHDAHALGPIDLEAGLKVGFSTNPDKDLGYNPLGFGLGARAGLDIFHIYLGGSFVHYFGDSANTVLGKFSTSQNLVGGELGYTITALPIIQIRPQIGLGDAIQSAELGNSGSNSKGYFYLEPGVTVLVPFGFVYAAVDGNALIMPAISYGSETKAWTSFTLHAQVGITF